VAVKQIYNQSNKKVVDDFYNEIQVLSRLRHPNCLLFMGACFEPCNLCILTEYMARGSLFDILHNGAIRLDLRVVVQMALDAARGMAYLHQLNPPISHRDLKSHNLLVDESWHVKVADFGVAKIRENSYANTVTGTYGWMAPEVMDITAPYTYKADIYSYGVVLWEMVTGQIPFANMNPLQITRAVVDLNMRPGPVPNYCPAILKDVILRCWEKDASKRPEFQEIIEILSCIQIK